MHPRAGWSDHRHRMRPLAPALLLLAPCAGCGVFFPADAEDLRMAAHAELSYGWTDDTCSRSGPECAEEYIEVAVDRARSNDEDVVETRVEDGLLTLVSHEPGEATVVLRGEDGSRRDLHISVVPAGGLQFWGHLAVDEHIVVLPDAQGVFVFDAEDDSGEGIPGVPRLVLTGTQGATAERHPTGNALVVTAPSTPGPFEIRDETIGTVLTGEVVTPAAIDGIADHISYLIPMVGERVLAAGELDFEISFEWWVTRCIVDGAENWSVPAPIPEELPRNYQGDERETWAFPAQLPPGEDSCGATLTIPEANEGAGVSVLIWK
jgi:hypothetical protein